MSSWPNPIARDRPAGFVQNFAEAAFRLAILAIRRGGRLIRKYTPLPARRRAVAPPVGVARSGRRVFRHRVELRHLERHAKAGPVVRPALAVMEIDELQ